MYRIFNVAVDSELALPELPGVNGPAGMPVYRFALARGADQAPPSAAVDWFHDWLDPHGHVTIRAGRGDGRHWLRFPHLADFAIDRAGQGITAFPEAATDESTLRHLLLDQVLPRVLFHSGRLVVHASAVGVGAGRSVAFLGPSGRGKSTLAAAYLQAGAPVLTDDCLMLQAIGSGFAAIPAYPTLRLWPDSLSALALHAGGPATRALESGKTRLALEQPAAPPGPVPLSALFLLGDPTAAPASRVELGPVRGNQAMMALIESAFVLDLVSKESVRRNFALVGGLARSGLPIYALNYPRRYAELAKVREAVAAAAQGAG